MALCIGLNRRHGRTRLVTLITMRIVIAGGHGKIALRLQHLLSLSGHEAIGLIRNPDHADALRDVGAQPVVCDLEKSSVSEVAAALDGADAVVFAAGAGPGSGAERKTTVDKDAAVLLADAAEEAKVRRYVMVSAMNVDDEPPSDTEPVFAAYLRAKGAADADLRSRKDLDWTILRPGRLTDDPGTGRVDLATKVERGDVSRDDVAIVLCHLLTTPATAGLTLELVNGDVEVTDAISVVSGD